MGQSTMQYRLDRPKACFITSCLEYGACRVLRCVQGVRVLQQGSGILADASPSLLVLGRLLGRGVGAQVDG